MPEAIATTKRRFFKALDSLSTTPAPSPPTASDTPSTSSTKRSSSVAFDEARERVRKRLRHSTSSGSLSSLGNGSVIRVPPPRSIAKDNANTNKPPPNFSPWSHETFLARLKTFSSVSMWHPKPDAINEVQWAKRGWACIDVNTVACKGGCEKRMIVSLNSSKKEAEGPEEIVSDEDEDENDADTLEDALVERYKLAIVDGHSSSCLWHRAGCKEDIYRLPVVRPTVWQPELRKRYQSLIDIHDSIKDVKTRTHKTFAPNLITELPNSILGPREPADSTSTAPFSIAMHGWRGSSDSGTPLLHCDACFQRIGLWMYQPFYQRPNSSNTEPGDKEEDVALIDLVEMHRDHCPWRNSETQQATGSLNGLNACEILQRVAATAARDHRRRSEMQVSSTPAEEDDEEAPDSPSVRSREEVARQDKERESRLRKLKNMFSLKKRSGQKPG